MFIRWCATTVSVCAVAFAALGAARSVFAQGDVRPIPPLGVAIAEPERASLTAKLADLTREIADLKKTLRGKPKLLRLLPDVEIYEKAVRYALTYNEFYNVKEAQTATQLLDQGLERARALRDGSAPWTTKPGLVVLGYVSRIDGSVQPYGMVVPDTWKSGDNRKRRMDFFCHGRGETLTELSFINDRQHNVGDFSPPDAFVLHPYGRYCNANRFAGEVDLFEALSDAKSRYPIDDNRLVIRGFSMGGASAWQYATHHTDVWAAATPGAGFSEAAGFLGLFGPGKTPPPWYEQKLLHWYDSTDWAINLSQLPTVAYNGDKDGQKQAADKMQDAMQAEGLTLVRVVGKDAGHWYTKEGKAEIDADILPAVAHGRNRLPAIINFTTWTLRYPDMYWVKVTGLGHHWERARVTAELGQDSVRVTTQNVTRFEIQPPATRDTVIVDGQTVTDAVNLPGEATRLVKDAKGKWTADTGSDRKLRKKPGLQGPIDDAFLDRFVMVRPTGTPLTPATGTWVTAEMVRAVREWRATFRGDAPTTDDNRISDEQIKNANLILWGDPQSNQVLGRIASRLPIRWSKDGTVHANGKTYPAGTSVPAFIFPNPLSPTHYVVVNSGITWREVAYLNNAQQRSRLPDWAIIDTTTLPDKYAPGRIADAGFFGEEWQFVPGPPAANAPSVVTGKSTTRK